MTQHSSERRRGIRPIPDNFTSMLNAQQAKALLALEEKGIVLHAVRRPLFQEPVFIVKIKAKDRYGVLLDNGTVDYFPDIPIREQRSLGDGFIYSDVSQVLD